MTNLLETASSVIRTLVDDDPRPPMHVGEVMMCWTYLATLRESVSYLEAALNTTTDRELKRAVEDSKRQCDAHADKLRSFMLGDGITLPPSPEPKPGSDPNAVPLGAKLTDEEIANGLSLKTTSLILSATNALTQSVRTDVGLLFMDFLNEKIAFGATLKELMRRRGWIKVPPYYYPPGLPQ